MDDLDHLDMGMVTDMFNERANDSIEYPYVATQEDMRNF